MASPSGSRVDVAVVDDHPLFVSALVAALAAEGLRAHPPVLSSPASLLVELVELAPAVALLDLELGGTGHGDDLVRPLCRAGIRVVVLTGITDELRLATCIEQGAVGTLAKTTDLPEVLSAVASVLDGRDLVPLPERERLRRFASRARSARASELAPFDRLSRREGETLVLLGDGKSVREIAAECFVSEATVRTQVRAVLAKLDVSSQLAAVAMARRARWPDGDELG